MSNSHIGSSIQLKNMILQGNTALRDGGLNSALELSPATDALYPSVYFSGQSATQNSSIVWTTSSSGDDSSAVAGMIKFVPTSTTNANFLLYTNNDIGGSVATAKVTILGNGNVGVGIGNPSNKFEVGGVIVSSGGAVSGYGGVLGNINVGIGDGWNTIETISNAALSLQANSTGDIIMGQGGGSVIVRNFLKVGSGNSADKYIYANTAATDKPALRYSSGKWQYSNDGSLFQDMGSGSSEQDLGTTDEPTFAGLNIDGDITVDGQITSSIATGTAPFIISSTTVVANLNADQLDGNDASAFAEASHDHTASEVTEDTTHRFITDTERTNWGTAYTNNHSHSNKTTLDSITAAYTTAEQTKLSGIATGATAVASHATNGHISINSTDTTVYTHPANHTASVITQDSSNRFVTDTQISNWGTAYTNNHTHSNKTTLDAINQSVATSATPSFNGLNLYKDVNNIPVAFALYNKTSGTTYGVQQKFYLGEGTNYIEGASLIAFQESAWSATASTQDSSFCIYTTKDGVPGEKFRITSDAVIWVNPAAGYDTNLYRAGANCLATDDEMIIRGAYSYRAAESNTAFYAKVDGDTQPRFHVTAGGYVYMGAGGSTAPDVNLYRSAADTLKTDDKFVATAGVETAYVVTIRDNGLPINHVRITTDSNWRFLQYPSGAMSWGDGTNVHDTNLYRQAAGQLQSDGELSLKGATEGSAAFASFVSGDNYLRWYSCSNGVMYWGPGNAVIDTNLYRGAAGRLQTDYDFYARRITVSGTTALAGYFYAGTTAPSNTNRMNYDGYFYATRSYNPVYQDYAEYFAKDEDLEAGDVVVANPDGMGYIKSRCAYEKVVVGVVSDQYAQCIGGDGGDNVEEKFAPIGLAGRVRVKVTGDIKPGDLLVSSTIPGVATSTDGYIPGTVLGKALQYHSGRDISTIEMLILNA